MATQNISYKTHLALNDLVDTLGKELLAIIGEWNGDESGELEDRTSTAEEAMKVMGDLVDLVVEL